MAKAKKEHKVFALCTVMRVGDTGSGLYLKENRELTDMLNDGWTIDDSPGMANATILKGVENDVVQVTTSLVFMSREKRVEVGPSEPERVDVVGSEHTESIKL